MKIKDLYILEFTESWAYKGYVRRWKCLICEMTGQYSNEHGWKPIEDITKSNKDGRMNNLYKLHFKRFHNDLPI